MGRSMINKDFYASLVTVIPHNAPVRAFLQNLKFSKLNVSEGMK